MRVSALMIAISIFWILQGQQEGKAASQPYGTRCQTPVGNCIIPVQYIGTVCFCGDVAGETVE